MENFQALKPMQVLWNYLGMHQKPERADIIVGFGNFDDNIARRAAELYHQGLAPKVLFSGGLGRNTSRIFTEPEAERFARVAMECGVPEYAIIKEDKSTNTAENILFVKRLLEDLNIPHGHILGVHQPFMERRIVAAMGVYWPEQSFSVTSPQMTIPAYLEDAGRQGMTENGAISVIVGDFQRMDLYARKGWQLPQEIPEEAWEAYHELVAMGYDKQLAK